jgi:hypothetical protein
MVVVHVEPVNDVVKHECDGGALCDCVCGPDVTFLDDAVIVTHHSLDGREESE